MYTLRVSYIDMGGTSRSITHKNFSSLAKAQEFLTAHHAVDDIDSVVITKN